MTPSNLDEAVALEMGTLRLNALRATMALKEAEAKIASLERQLADMQKAIDASAGKPGNVTKLDAA
jgi:hypothetical protein